MKTLTILLLFFGMIWVQSGFALTTLNLPANEVYINPVDKLTTLTKIVLPANDILKKIPAKKPKKDSGDTIVIDLSEVVITSPFPANSRKCILEQVPYPAFAQEEFLEGCVTVRFAFDTTGNIHVLEANSTDPRLETYVTEKLEQLELSCCMVEISKDYFIRFWFKLY